MVAGGLKMLFRLKEVRQLVGKWMFGTFGNGWEMTQSLVTREFHTVVEEKRLIH